MTDSKHHQEDTTPPPLVETVSSKAQAAVDDVTNLVLMEEQTRKNESIIQKEHDEDHKLVTKKVPFFRRLASRFPRLYYFTTQLILPLLILIGMAFLFGWGLALLESKGEIEANDDAFQGLLTAYAAYSLDRNRIHATVSSTPEQCLRTYDGNSTVQELTSTPQREDIMEELLVCATEKATERFPIMEFSEFFFQSSPELTFNWIDCERASFDEDQDPEAAASDYVQQYVQYLEDYFSDVEYQVRTIDTGNETENLELALELASGAQSCKPHVAGGALFWFTIMTTIGYGNTAPETEGARLLVFTCGFITIIGFLALNSTASNILMAIVDDLLIRVRLRRLTNGLAAVVFWLCLMILWMLVLATFFKSWMSRRSGGEMTLADAYWFSYVTTTTVGFGDIYIPHEEFKAGDMFTIPLGILFSFVILGNFASKLVDCFATWFPADLTLESLLEASRGEDGTQLCPKLERRHSL